MKEDHPDAIGNIQKPDFAKANSRISNMLLDTVLFYLLYYWTILYSYSLFDIDVEANPLLDILVIVFLHLLVYVPTEYFFQKSPAKFLTQTKVVTDRGEKPGFKTILTRSFCRLVPFEAFSFLFLDVGIHDKFSKTRVVND